MEWERRRKARLHQIFGAADADGDGSLDVHEFERLLHAVNEAGGNAPLGRREITTIYRAAVQVFRWARNPHRSAATVLTVNERNGIVGSSTVRGTSCNTNAPQERNRRGLYYKRYRLNTNAPPPDS
jgi:hypothetical protein